MKNRFNKELAFNLIYLIPFYLANKLAQIFRLLQGGDFIDKVITSFANLSFLAQHPWLSFKLQDLLIGLIAAGLLKLIVVIRSQNRKKFARALNMDQLVGVQQKISLHILTRTLETTSS